MVSASLGNAHILPCKCVASRSGGHHDELRSGEKMDAYQSFRRPFIASEVSKSPSVTEWLTQNGTNSEDMLADIMTKSTDPAKTTPHRDRAYYHLPEFLAD